MLKKIIITYMASGNAEMQAREDKEKEGEDD